MTELERVKAEASTEPSAGADGEAPRFQMFALVQT